MSKTFKDIWEIYVSSWKAEDTTDKLNLFKKSLDTSCVYNDPLTKAHGWDELINYMLDFHKQIPGGYFLTTYFMAHSNKSIAKWNMNNGEGQVMGDGISYCAYNDDGKLISITGFFETPKG